MTKCTHLSMNSTLSRGVSGKKGTSESTQIQAKQNTENGYFRITLLRNVANCRVFFIFTVNDGAKVDIFCYFCKRLTRKVNMARQESTVKRANFGSKLGVILATAGSAVGLGNVWRFPYMTGENGGAVFIMIYIVCVLLLGIPCMISEFIIGRHAQANTARAFRKMSGGSAWSVIGYMGVLTGFLITGYTLPSCP